MMTQAQPVQQTVPRGALIGAAVLMVGTLVIAALARHPYLAPAATDDRPPIASCELRFADRADGTLAAYDATTGREVSDVTPQSNGFIRGVLRGMFRTRKLESMGRDATFRLAREADGHLTLTDRETSRRIDLDSFGPTNSEAFATLLTAGTAGSAAPPTVLTGKATPW
jgi:putative photosynthetic complex assembly protein